MGFMATYWGYKSMQEVERYMHEFRQRELPIDSFIMDYDWFGPDPCPAADDDEQAEAEAEAGALSPQGGSNCGDYGYRRGWWDNVTFTQDGTSVFCETPKDCQSLSDLWR